MLECQTSSLLRYFNPFSIASRMDPRVINSRKGFSWISIKVNLSCKLMAFNGSLFFASSGQGNVHDYEFFFQFPSSRVRSIKSSHHASTLLFSNVYKRLLKLFHATTWHRTEFNRGADGKGSHAQVVVVAQLRVLLDPSSACSDAWDGTQATIHAQHDDE